MDFLISTASDFLKAKAAAQGETRIRKDGKTWKKTGMTWVVVSNPTAVAPVKGVENVAATATKKGEKYFNYALSTNLGDVVDDVLQSEGIDSYKTLVEKVKTGPQDMTHKLYKKIVDALIANSAPHDDKQTAMHLIGTSLVTLKEQFTTRPKVTAKVKVTSKKGTEYYKYKDTEDLPLLKPTSIAKAKKKMAGWSVTGTLESKHVRGMIKTKVAKLTFGKIDSKKKWHLPKKAEDMKLKYTGDHLLLKVKQIRKVKDRTRATAKVEIKLPYEFAKAFLQKQIASKKTANNFIFRLENSSGYRNFMARAAA